MDSIILSNAYIKLEFSISNNKVNLSFLGTINENFINDKNQKGIVEIDTSETNHNGSHCSKTLNSELGSSLNYVKHEFINANNKKELIITSKNDVFLVEMHYLLYNNAAAFSSFSVVKNISNKEIHLEKITSFYGYGFSQNNQSYKNMYIHFASNSWHCEAQWKRRSFLDAGIFNGNDSFTMKRWLLSNTGSWSTKDYLPMCIIENADTKHFILGQIENNGSWNIEVGDYLNNYYFTLYGPSIDNLWSKTLKPSETFISCQTTLTLGDSFEKVIQEITKARREMVTSSLDNNELPVIFNDYMHALWDTQTEKLILPLVDLASSLGCEEFVIDAGWFAKGCGWTDFIGEWNEYSDNFPNGGLKGTIDYIHKHNMKAGLWVEIENMGIKCPLANKLPDDFFFMINGHRAIRNNRYALNFANQKVFDWAFEKVSNLINKYQLDYIKNDYNVDSGPGNEFDSDSIGDGLLKHNRAFINFIKKLRNRFPLLTIENCGSGGCRMDYEILKYCPIQSTSDQTDYRKYPYLSSAVLTAAIPEQAAVWSYPLNKQIKEIPTDEVVVMNMVNAMLGRIHLASYINELSEKQIKLVKEGIMYYKQTRDFKKGSLPIYPNGISYFFDKSVVGGLIKDKHIMLCVWNTSGNNNSVKVDLSKYDIKSIKVGYPTSLTTDYQFKNGFLTFSSSFDYQGRVFEIELK